MANDGKFLNLTGGLTSQENAIAVSAGAGDAGKIVMTGAGGKLDTTFMPAGVGAESRTALASEALSAGDLINLYSNAGVPTLRKADASAPGKPADGFVLAAVANGATGTYWPEEAVLSGLTGLTPGQDVFLSVTTPGVTTTTIPSGSGKVNQKVGKTISATEVMFRRGDPVTLA
jgi:hypothetical protein